MRRDAGLQPPALSEEKDPDSAGRASRSRKKLEESSVSEKTPDPFSTFNELEDTQKVSEHIAQHGHTLPVLLDQDNHVANQYGVFGLPVSVFIDETWRIGEYIKGGLLTEQKIQETVNRIRTPPTERRTAALH